MAETGNLRGVVMEEKYDKKAAIEAILEYIYFMENNRDRNGEISPEDPMKFDSRRKQLHLAIASIFGLSEDSYPSYRNVLDFTTLEGFIWDKWITDGRKAEDYAEILYWGIVDKLNKHRAPYTEIETEYKTKLRIDDILKWTREKIEKRMKPIDEVMDEYKANRKAWNEDHNEKNKDEPYLYDHSNLHDYNGFVSSINSDLRKIKLFAEQPMEAYLKVAVEQYVDKPLASIDETLKKLDGIAFRAQEQYKTEPFYKYLDKRKKIVVDK